MSSMSFTSRRQIWSNQHPLRKQRSFADSSTNSNSNLVNQPVNSDNLFRSDRSKLSVFQKQYSVDQIYNNSSRSVGNFRPKQQIHQLRFSARPNEIKGTSASVGAKNFVNNNNGIQRPATDDVTSQLSLISNGKKKSILRGYGDNKKERITGNDRLKKSSKGSGSDDRVNLNIFLSQTIVSSDIDDGNSSDDQESSTESNDTVKSLEKQDTIEESNNKTLPPRPLPIPVIPINTLSNFKKPLTAAARRAAFHASRENGTINCTISVSPPGCRNKNNNNPNIVTNPTNKVASITSNNNITTNNNNNQTNKSSIPTDSSPLPTTTIISASPSLTVERRPPLIRAMSAPIRTLDENSKNILANKRKSRRRKILTRAPTLSQPSPTSNGKLIESTKNLNCDENDDSLSDKNRGRKNNRKSLSRTRSTIGCDVVTLVSLISSEGSDSEREEDIIPVIQSPIKRAPTLRKTGKSVSFQDNDIPNFPHTTREYPHMIRRGSIAPLAARIRANRPPTAPPVSIFMSDLEQRDSKMGDKAKSSSKEDISTKSSSEESKENSNSNNTSKTDNVQFPEHVKSVKERECWKLFQTMCNKGVSVTYDTVLRGMLTPTELRQILQKQKELEQKQRIINEKTDENEDPTTKKK